MSRFAGQRALALVVVFAAYVLAGRIGLSLAFVHANASAVWPPAGIAVGALLLLGVRAWPTVAVGAFVVNLATSGSVAASSGIAAGNTLEAVAAMWLATRFARGPLAFDRTPDIIRFTAIAALPAAAVAATAGVTTLVGTGLASPAQVGSIWLTWWLGDAVGIVLVTPLLLTWARPSAAPWTRARVLEALGLAACVGVVAWTVFGASPFGIRQYAIQFLVTPVFLWAAFRFSARETIAAAIALSVVAIAGTLSGMGPFARGTPNESLLLLQTFIGATTVAMLSVAAEVAARRSSDVKIRGLNDALERRVADRTDELTKMHGRLADAQQVAHVGSWEWDVRANSLWWSDELYRIYGLDQGAESSYESFLARVHPDDRNMVDGSVRRAAGDGRPFTFDHRIRRPDGSTRVIHAEGRVVLDADGRCMRMMGTGHDITERKRAEEERAQLIHEQAARREAEESNRMKDRFLAVLSHELRTPLNAALGWAQMVRVLPQSDERVRTSMEAIYRNLLIQARLVSDILDVSRVATGRLTLDRAPVEVAAVIQAALEASGDPAVTSRVTLRTQPPSGPMVVAGDAQRLQQVVWNLIENAVKFAGADCAIEVVATRNGDVIELLVTDNGPGIPDAFLPHVFEQFRQADSSVTREHGGLGLGLTIARHIVELHGGSISAANRPGGGAIFRVQLPAAVGVAEEEPAT